MPCPARSWMVAREKEPARRTQCRAGFFKSNQLEFNNKLKYEEVTMSHISIIKIFVAALGLALFGLSPVQASTVLYNTNGGTFLVGNDGKRPPNWVGTGTAPTLTGTMDLMWYADLQSSDAATLTTADAIAKGAPSNFKLGTGPAAWGSSASGHGLDYGLIHLNGSSDLTITMETDTGSSTKPAFSLYQGWDTSTTPFVRAGSYINNVSNPG